MLAAINPIILKAQILIPGGSWKGEKLTSFNGSSKTIRNMFYNVYKIEVRNHRGPVHITNVLFLQKITNGVSSMWPCIIVHKQEMQPVAPRKNLTWFQGPHLYSAVRWLSLHYQRSAAVYDCPTWWHSKQRFHCPQSGRFAFCWKETSDEDSSGIILWAEWLISEKNTPPFWMCLRLVCSAP